MIVNKYPLEVGDIIESSGGNIKARVTAVGEKKFLYKRIDREDLTDEYVATIKSKQPKWKVV